MKRRSTYQRPRAPWDPFWIATCVLVGALIGFGILGALFRTAGA